MRLRPLAAALPLTVGLTSVACQKETPPPPPTAPAAEAKAAPAAPTAPASISGHAAADCIAPFASQGEETTVQLAGRTYKKRGSVLSVTSPDEDKNITVGVIANIKEATGENRFNLKRYFSFFKEQQAEAILIDGDSGDTSEEIHAVLTAVAESTDLPVLVIPGNREPRAEFQAAVNAVASKRSNLINMTQVRLVNFDDVSVVSLPGYYDKRFINAGAEGCQYFKEDIDALAPIVAAAAGPVLLMSHAEPYGQGKAAIDAFPDGNAGDENLRKFLSTSPVAFGVFANMHEAGGRGADLLSNVIKEGEEKEKLFVNVGAADSTAWPLNDNTTSHGMVATFTVKAGKGSFKTFRAPKLTEAEIEEAKKLVPVVANVAATPPQDPKAVAAEKAAKKADEKKTAGVK